MANGVITPAREEVENVAYTAGSQVSIIYGNFIRKGNLVYFSLYINGTCSNVQEILTITDAKNYPKNVIRFGGAYDGGSYHGGACFYINKIGKMYQEMATDTNLKLMSVSGVYEAAG